MSRRITILFLALTCVLSLCAQDEDYVPFNGLVEDLLGQPIRSVRVYTIDRNYYTVTDRKGRFGLSNVQPGDTLHLTYRRLHYDIPVDGRKSMHIVLGDQYVLEAEQSEDLENLGYGYVPRRESVSSSRGITGEVLRRTGKTNILEALQGLVAGLVIIVDQMGQSSVAIRGYSSILCDTTPLFLVDGTEVPSFDMISIYDVESVEIMKEAYIYGTRGANGAILVTTKTGASK